jgi:hypothetical protein
MDGWFLEQQPQRPVFAREALPWRPRPRHSGGRRRIAPDVEHLEQLCPSERATVRQIHYANSTGRSCRTQALERDLGDFWRPGTIRNSLGRLRDHGVISKRGWAWQVTPRWLAIVEQYEREQAG